MARVFPTKRWLRGVVKHCKMWATPQLTVSIDGMGNWSYQTGDNSYHGDCYGDPVWAVVDLPLDVEWGARPGDLSGVSSNYNIMDVVDDILEQLHNNYEEYVNA